jgi:hypothetical protein
MNSRRRSGQPSQVPWKAKRNLSIEAGSDAIRGINDLVDYHQPPVFKATTRLSGPFGSMIFLSA